MESFVYRWSVIGPQEDENKQGIKTRAVMMGVCIANFLTQCILDGREQRADVLVGRKTVTGKTLCREGRVARMLIAQICRVGASD